MVETGAGNEANKVQDTVRQEDMIFTLDGATGKYANYVRVQHTQADFLISFGLKSGKGPVSGVAMVAINPTFIKTVVRTIMQNIEHYEQATGLVLPNNTAEYLDHGICKKPAEGAAN